MYYWISWTQPTEDYRPLTYPPNHDVLGWWCSGYSDQGSIICAMVKADTEEIAKAVIIRDWPEADKVGWRFCNVQTKEDLARHTHVDSRFPAEGWAEERFKAEIAKFDGTRELIL